MAKPTPISNVEEVLNRQVPSVLWDDAHGRPMSTAFSPSSRDEGMLSTLRGRVAPKEAHRRYTRDLGYDSLGTWGVRVGDAHDLKLTCVDDGGIGEAPVDHASVDFGALARNDRKVAGRKLRDLAGLPLYVPTGTD